MAKLPEHIKTNGWYQDDERHWLLKTIGVVNSLIDYLSQYKTFGVCDAIHTNQEPTPPEKEVCSKTEQPTPDHITESGNKAEEWCGLLLNAHLAAEVARIGNIDKYTEKAFLKYDIAMTAAEKKIGEQRKKIEMFINGIKESLEIDDGWMTCNSICKKLEELIKGDQ